MDKSEILRLAKDAGFSTSSALNWIIHLDRFAGRVAAAVKEEDARICEATRRALEENRAVWAANPMLTPDEDYIADWESSACRGEEYAADIRASIKEVK